MIQLVLATRNAHKTEEIRALLSGAASVCSLTRFPEAPPVVEDAPTMEGNARKKALELAQWLSAEDRLVAGLPEARGGCCVMADDSGLEVDALDGAPGVHSARFAAMDGSGNAPDADNNAKLMRLLREVPEARRGARFRCVLALVAVPMAAEGKVDPCRIFEGVCPGRIALAASGSGGFGYDPMFIPQGFDLSFAELGESVKNRISHRARAVRLAVSNF